MLRGELENSWRPRSRRTSEISKQRNLVSDPHFNEHVSEDWSRYEVSLISRFQGQHFPIIVDVLPFPLRDLSFV